MTTIKAAVIGASGYAGAELVRILAGHPRVTLTHLTCRQDAGERFDKIYPSLTPWAQMSCDAYDLKQFIADGVQVAFTALPHQLPMAIVPDLLRAGIKVVDLSADFRFKDAALYQAHYQAHSAVDLLPEAVYGLSEVYTAAVRGARLVGNPGCYPTCTLLPLIPLLKAGLIRHEGIVVDAKSGVSGAGRGATLTTHFCQVNESFKAYKVATHRHTPEMEAILSEQAGKAVRIVFVPHLLPLTRGMEATIYADARPGAGEAEMLACIADDYRGRPFVRLRGSQPADTLHVKGTNFIDISVKMELRTGKVIIMSAIDNLVKGAAGQAVQNMNLMFGLDETTGLWQVPWAL
jgi:N-acetyl-gamma-glutamyl-phosphate reductase